MDRLIHGRVARHTFVRRARSQVVLEGVDTSIPYVLVEATVEATPLRSTLPPNGPDKLNGSLGFKLKIIPL